MRSDVGMGTVLHPLKLDVGDVGSKKIAGALYDANGLAHLHSAAHIDAVLSRTSAHRHLLQSKSSTTI